tara:strand:- start:262 stop:567 length:306 start_codon:yes stop_codon:yes gene_type:complete
MIVYYFILILKLSSNDNFQNQFIRFSIKNIYQNYKEKIKKKFKKINYNNNSLFNPFYTTKYNNEINYDELYNYIQIILKNQNINDNKKSIIHKKIVKNYLD